MSSLLLRSCCSTDVHTASKPSYPPGIGAGYSGLNSYGKFMSMSSSKDILGTLEHVVHGDDNAATTPLASPNATEIVSSPVEVVEAAPPSAPAVTPLRPLSLSPGLVQALNNDLPTPAESPSLRPGLKSLNLSDAPDAETLPSWANRRQSMMVHGSSSAVPPIRRLSLGASLQSKRRSSIPYFSSDDRVSTSNYGLPTPELTPVSERRYSQDSSSSGSRSSRSLSLTEQHFLYQAHNALVQRISDLERALSARPRSRPQSYASDVSSQNEVPNDEMLQLIADLKSERDELKKDVDGWRTRVADFEHQSTLLMKRVENERREAWVARERMGLMETEKRAIETSLSEKIAWGEEGWKKAHAAEAALFKAEEECRRLRAQADREPELELEISQLTVALAEERKKREEVEKELESVLRTPTPQTFELSQYRTPPVPRSGVFAKRGGLGFRSVDSSSSSTDVESIDESLDRHQLSLKVVHEEEEDDGLNDDLACYEDEDEDDDYTFETSASNSSFDSDSDEPRDTSHLIEMSVDGEYVPELSSETSSSPPTPAPPSPQPSHERRASLVKAWTFPQVVEPSTTLARDVEEIDRFFGCLEDVDNSPPLDARLRSLESSKNLFSQALADAEDDIPFMIPSDVGVEVTLSNEEDEEDEGVIVGQEVEGGIIFTFTPPSSFEGPSPSRSFVSSIPIHSASTSAKPVSTRIPRMSESPSSPSTPPKRGPLMSSIPRPLQSPPSPSSLASSPKVRSSSFIPQPRKTQSGIATSPKAQNKPRMTSGLPNIWGQQRRK
ncbi:hypothetical protein BC629DRAFT_1527420 [Irpex lacteus]|nr:hypothetical protein BC629DRAFT_1527420 [Irpex lacteus]